LIYLEELNGECSHKVLFQSWIRPLESPILLLIKKLLDLYYVILRFILSVDLCIVYL